ncbi:hypothetical protein F511_30549 [Dorcoceras hygrometricum]|uniref:Uncharacterized protein n=1 Tax=Dorcoceras hygrometricum TaxID=472368 RepID=A0A2Z7D7V1_9LAMI|nr:hypothetical protein F511_30549 [Dorcoceras hygrometricum]
MVFPIPQATKLLLKSLISIVLVEDFKAGAVPYNPSASTGKYTMFLAASVKA